MDHGMYVRYNRDPVPDSEVAHDSSPAKWFLGGDPSWSNVTLTLRLLSAAVRGPRFTRSLAWWGGCMLVRDKSL